MGLFKFLFTSYSRPQSYSKVFVDDNGYFRFKDTGILVHRWAAEKKIGRKLRPGEVVHHINRNKRDNSPENLMVLPDQVTHDKLHREEALLYGEGFSYWGGRKRLTLYYLLECWRRK